LLRIGVNGVSLHLLRSPSTDLRCSDRPRLAWVLIGQAQERRTRATCPSDRSLLRGARDRTATGPSAMLHR
jgi:hypothetical protein